MQFFSINSVQIPSWSYIYETIYCPDPIQIQQNSAYAGSSPIQVQSIAHLWCERTFPSRTFHRIRGSQKI